MKGADPEVQMRTTGSFFANAIPIAIKAADRSSLMIRVFIFGCRVKANVRGAERDPGQIIASVIPFSEQMYAMVLIL